VTQPSLEKFWKKWVVKQKLETTTKAAAATEAVLVVLRHSLFHSVKLHTNNHKHMSMYISFY